MALFTNHKEGLAVAARTIGLTYDGNYSLLGEREGISVGVRLWSTHSNDQTNYYTTVEARHPIPLRMSLTVSRQGSLGRFLLATFGGQDIPTGHAELDLNYRICARDPARATALLSEPDVRSALLGVLGARHNAIQVTDIASSITIGGWRSETEELRGLLNTTHSVADSVRRVRARIPLSDAEQRARAALSEASASLGLPCDPERLEVSGQRARQHAIIRAVYQPAGNWTTEFEVRFPDSLNLGLRLLPQEGFWSTLGSLFGTQDVKVGHPAFDAQFKVKGKPEPTVARLLTGPVADHILALHAVAKELHVGDEAVRATATGLMDDGPSLTRSLTAVDALASAIAERAWGGSSAPYR